MTEVVFTIPGEPVSKARARFTSKGGKVRSYTPAKTITGEQRVAHEFKAAGGRFEADPEVTFRVSATFYNGTRQRRDVDNMLKLILDGLNGVAWVDDTQVMEVAGRKRFTSKAEARTEVEVVQLGQMSRLTAKCANCLKDFITYESVKDKVRFCSTECRSEGRESARRRICEQCGSEFLAHGKTHPTRFCSRACRSAFGRTTIPCAVCGTEFEQYKSWVKQRPYCSTDCVKRNNALKARARRKSASAPPTSATPNPAPPATTRSGWC